MTLRSKLLLSFTAFVALLAVVNIIATQYIIDRRIRLELETSEVTFAKGLGTRLAKSTRAKDRNVTTEIVLDERGLRAEKIDYIVLFSSDGKLLAHTFLRPLPKTIVAMGQKAPPPKPQVTLFDNEELFVYDVAVPVVEGIEAVGVIHVGLRGAYLEGIRDDIVRALLQASIAVFATAVGIAWLVGLFLVQPLRRLTDVVRAISAGNWSALELLKHSREAKDEVGVLASAFREMGSSVLEKTSAIELVLDNMGDALLSARLDGTLVGRVSAEARRLFGAPPECAHVWDYLCPENATLHASFKLGFGEFADDIMPFELVADQMPHRLVREGKTFKIRYRPVRDGDTLERLLLIVQDVTELEAAERQSEAAQELQTIIGQILRDRQAFTRFLADAEQLLSRLMTATEVGAQKRDLHTLKGNLAIMGFASVARQCHACEDALAETLDPLSEQQLSQLASQWRRALVSLSERVPLGDNAAQVALLGSDYERLVRKLENHTDHGLLLALVKSWRYLPASSVLSGLAAQAKRLGKSLGKEVSNHVFDPGLRLDLDQASDFWNCMIHVVRNAVDHGIETVEERRAARKPDAGTVAFAAYSHQGALVVVVADDGRGIDIEALRSRAGLPQSASQDEVIAAIFADGVSTRQSVSETSGRGVGMGALKAACDKLGVVIRVRTQEHRGTSFSFTFPAENSTGQVHFVANSLIPPGPEGGSVESAYHYIGGTPIVSDDSGTSSVAK